MITQGNQSPEKPWQTLASENSSLRTMLHTIGVEAAQALDWTNEEAWKSALQRIAALARGEEASGQANICTYKVVAPIEGTSESCRTVRWCETLEEAEQERERLIQKTGNSYEIRESTQS